jgi:tetratricopeptide (TPR) repeat protein
LTSTKLEPGTVALFQPRRKTGKVDEAIRDYDGVILLRVSPREAYFNRGTLLLNKKEYKAAINDFDAAISLDPKYDVALYNRGLAHYSLKNYFAAQADFNNLIKLQPKHTNAYIMRSYVYCAQGLRMSAIKDQQMAVQLGGNVEIGCK